jgi:hypothetical protein
MNCKKGVNRLKAIEYFERVVPKGFSKTGAGKQ